MGALRQLVGLAAAAAVAVAFSFSVVAAVDDFCQFVGLAE
jgi:hypothetical protein